MNKNNIAITAFSIFITLIQISLICFYIVNHLPLIIIILNVFILFFYCLLCVYFFRYNKKLKLLQINLENLKIHNNILSKLYDNVRAFKHDFNNIMSIIGGFIENNDMSNLKKYYDGINKDCNQVNNLTILNPQIINNPGLYNLLLSKYKKIDESNIELNLECFFDFAKLHMPIYDLSRILGIFIDNAIEAASNTKEKRINITFRDSINNHTQLIKIQNSYNDKNIDKTKIFEKGITGKANHSGIGLWEVKNILKRNKNVNLITTNNENYFTQQIEIYYKK